ncbi:GNAT family N-acetyltransferase [Massilia sp. W12]|uniref:GNAT family N-acetyltransferase n=1 Tax=Massilia sp. W12 TaxID=3126507 RepID=UPI0030CD8B00
MSIHLRPAHSADADAVAHILITARALFLPFAPSPHSAADIRQWVAHTLLPGGGVTVALQDGRVAGVLALSFDGACHWLDQLYLAPQLLGQGVGRQLLQHALAQCGRPLRLYCFAQNSRARAFYERHGFVPLAFGDGSGNEEKCPDVLYEYRAA